MLRQPGAARLPLGAGNLVEFSEDDLRSRIELKMTPELSSRNGKAPVVDGDDLVFGREILRETIFQRQQSRNEKDGPEDAAEEDDRPPAPWAVTIFSVAENRTSQD